MKYTKIIDLRICLNIKILKDAVIMSRIIKRFLFPYIPRFREALLFMLMVFLARAYMMGNIVPRTIALFVNAIKSLNNKMIIDCIIIFISMSLVYLVSEFILLKYFTKLVDGITILKNRMIEAILKNTSIRVSKEDLVGRISSDVDYAIWNMNSILISLVPNLFTSIVATITIFMFDRYIGLITFCTLFPYILIVEFYSRRTEPVRLRERQIYSLSITHIRDIIYGAEDSRSIKNVLDSWRVSMYKVLWYDRIFWSLSFLVQFVSMALVTYIVFLQALTSLIDEGVAAGVISATLTAHTMFINAVWAICIQSQTTPAVKRIIDYLSDYDIE